MRTLIVLLIVTRTASEVCDHQNSVRTGLKNIDSEYFVDGTGVERGCVCIKETCGKKCCPFGQGYDEKNLRCANLSVPFNPSIWSKTKRGYITNDYHYFYTKMKCSDNEVAVFMNDVVNDFYLNTDGTLHVDIEDGIPSHITYDQNRYCIDNFFNENNKTKVNGLICFETQEKHYNYMLNSICMLISCFFIILTVAVYVFLPNLRNTIPGMVMVAHLTSFFISFLIMATMQILLYMENISRNICLGMSYTIYFSTLAAFFWMNVMCYDLWRKFRSVNITIHGNIIEKRARFFWYCFYAFGIPTALTILLAALEFSSHVKYNKFLPNLRRQGCFLTGMGRLIYFYAPMLIICVANLIFFVLVTIKIAQIKKQMQHLHKRDTQRYFLYFKLFLVTGSNWFLEAISIYYPAVGIPWQFTDAYNLLVGLVIFIIFICKKKIYNDLKQRYHDLMTVSKPQQQSNTASFRYVQTKFSHSKETQPMESNTTLNNILDNTA